MVGVYTDPEEHLHVVYSKKAIIQALQEDEGMTEEEALDWYYYNTARAVPFMGVSHPIIIEP